MVGSKVAVIYGSRQQIILVQNPDETIYKIQNVHLKYLSTNYNFLKAKIYVRGRP